MRPSANGSSWAIATPSGDATGAGVEAFERGGNAIDAALAAATAIAVTAPASCGVGGDLFALIQRPDGETLCVSSSGRAPAGADPDALRREHREMPVRGPIPITVPGVVAGWRAVYDLGAVRPWGHAFTRAIGFANDGVRLSTGLAETLTEPGASFASDPGLASIFFPGGGAAAAGTTVVQPALGETLAAIAAGGPDALYRGDVGRAYVGGLRAAGSPISTDDLGAHRALVLPPIRAAYRDLHVSVAPPNSQGFVLLQILSLLERIGVDPDPLGADAGTLARVFAAAAADRDRHLADPDRMLVHPSTLLDDGHLAGLADDLRAEHAVTPHGGRPDGDTIALVTADAEGFAVSLIQSLFWGFGSGICEPATGIVAHNRGACFTLEPGHPNAFTPGARPAHTLMPVLIHDERGLATVAGTMGGYAQPQINAQTLLHLVGGAGPADAVAAPRWIVERGAGAPVTAEAGVSEPARASIAAAGFGLDDVPDRSSDTGHAQLIRVRANGFAVGSDPRSDGGAAAG